MARTERYVVGLDIGTSKVCCMIAQVREDLGVHIVGIGESPSRGLRKGIVVNLDATVSSVKAAVAQAELMAGVQVDTAVVGIAGGHVRSFNSRGVIAVSGRDRTVSRDDLSRVMDAARAVSIPQDREILHVLPQEFVLDEQGGIHSPVGMTGSRLEANVHIVTAASTSVQNLVTCANHAGIEVREPVLEQLAIAETVLTPDERELGVALIDVGGGTTDVAIFERGALWHTATLPVGGDLFSNDLAVGLRTPVVDAERLKIRHGCALASMVQENDAIDVPTVGDRKPPRQLSRQVMAEILQPRAEELFTLLHEEIVRAGFDRVLNAGVVLTGGGSLLPGVAEVAEQVFELPVRPGIPQGVEGLVEPNAGPSYATVIGLVMFGARHRPEKPRFVGGMNAGVIARVGDRVRTWFAEIF